MPKIILCRGIQGSGKTTWAKSWVLEDPKHRIRFNNDDIRNMLGNARSNIRKCCKREVKTSLGFIYAFPNDDIQERVNELSQRKHLSKTESYELQRKSKIQ